MRRLQFNYSSNLVDREKDISGVICINIQAIVFSCIQVKKINIWNMKSPLILL